LASHGGVQLFAHSTVQSGAVEGGGAAPPPLFALAAASARMVSYATLAESKSELPPPPVSQVQP